MEASTIYRRKPDFIHEVLEDEVLLYYPGALRALCMNGTASMVWSLCDGELTTGDIKDMLTEAYPDAATEIASDVEAALAELSEFEALIPL